MNPTSFVPRLLSIGILALCFAAGCDKAKTDSVRFTNQGMRALEKNELRMAKSRFQQAVDVYPDNAKAHYGLGIVLRELGQADRAAKHLKEAVRLKPDLSEASYHLGDMAFAAKRFDEAEQAFRRVLEQDAYNGSAYYLRGRIHETKVALKQAEVAYRRAVNLEPYRPDIFLTLARLYNRVGAEEEAVAVLREGIRLCTSDRVTLSANLSLLHNELGVMLQERRQYGQAIDELLKAVRITGAPQEVAFNLGWAYADKGDSAHALRYFRQFVAVAKDDDPAIPVALEVQRHLLRRIERKTARPPSGG